MDADKRRWLIQTIGAFLVMVGSGVGILAIDRVMTRKDRVRHDARVRDLISVRDEVLRYEFELGRLPKSLDELVPLYLRKDQLTDGDGAQHYSYQPDARKIALATPTRIRGVFTRSRPPVEMELPASDAPLKPNHQTAVPEPVGPVMPAPVKPPVAEAPNVTPIAGMLKLDVSEGPELPAPPRRAYVFEAEHFSETNYGWEVRPDADAAAGAYIHSKEGIANGPGQRRGIFDFYNIREGSEYTYLKYHVHIPKAGRYFIQGRFWTTGSHCSNCVIVGVDQGGPKPGGGYYGTAMSNRTPFRWVWTLVGEEAKYLSAGDHYFHLFLHEDGERIDQIMLSPNPIRGNQAYQANLEVERETSWVKNAPKVDLLFDLKSMVMTSEMPPVAKLALRRHGQPSGMADLKIMLEETVLMTGQVDLAKLPELAFLPIDFSKIELKKLPRREHLLRAVLTLNGKAIAQRHVPMMHPFRWEVAGPFSYLVNKQPGLLDADLSSQRRPWKPFKDSSWDHFGVLDFGLQIGNNSLHAPELVTVYGRTRIRVPKSDMYLLKIQSDDQMLLWIDGKLVHFHSQTAPVTRSVKRLPLHLEAGEHRIRIRVNQGRFSSYGDGRWQASLRIRTQSDELSDVTGLE